VGDLDGLEIDWAELELTIFDELEEVRLSEFGGLVEEGLDWLRELGAGLIAVGVVTLDALLAVGGLLDEWMVELELVKGLVTLGVDGPSGSVLNEFEGLAGLITLDKYLE